MKYLLVLAVVLFGVWLWRNNRRAERDEEAARKAPPPALPQDMVRCPVCALHLPRADALPGRGGALYCSAEHRSSAGG
ncbi:MAG: PP0621 family protein [Ramlibacter sp.]